MQSRRDGWCRATVVPPRGRGQCGNTPSSNFTTPPACGGHMLTGADGAGNPLGLVAGPPRTPLGVAVTMGTGWCPLVPAHTWQGWGVVSRAGTTCPSEHPQGRTWEYTVLLAPDSYRQAVFGGTSMTRGGSAVTAGLTF